MLSVMFNPALTSYFTLPLPRSRSTNPRSIAGADIKEISELDAAEAAKRRYLEDLCLGIKAVKKPILAAVEGVAVSPTYHLDAALFVSPFGVVSTDGWMTMLNTHDKSSSAAVLRLR